MDDSISRQAAIANAISGITREIDGEKWIRVSEVRESIKTLPPAQPEIIRCKDCKNSEHWYRDRRRCFLWSEEGVSVFDDGFCNYAEMRMK
jgi:hypothetical protein